MNKAFTRESDNQAEYCPRCGSQGEPVGPQTLQAHLPAEALRNIAQSASFCPSPQCPVAYFDVFERVVLASQLLAAVYPKSPEAPICACFGLSADDIRQDVRENVVTRTRAAVEKSKSPAARCVEKAANGRPCTAYVQSYYMQCRNRLAKQ